jgi:hypothetical protein
MQSGTKETRKEKNREEWKTAGQLRSKNDRRQQDEKLEMQAGTMAMS